MADMSVNAGSCVEGFVFSISNILNSPDLTYSNLGSYQGCKCRNAVPRETALRPYGVLLP